MNNITALAKIESARKIGALIFVDKEWLEEKTPLYKMETTELEINKEKECFNISGKFMPKREVVDRIGESSGIDFILGETKSNTVHDDTCGKRTVYTAYAQGRRLLPDGSWRTSSRCDYEFDPVLRAMLDYDVTELTEATKQKQRKDRAGRPYGSTLARYILELQKVAAQRANTGARLRVIRELVGIPIAFEGNDLDKPLYFGRIVQNTDYILKTPEGRNMATAKALGLDVAALFGAKRALPPAEPAAGANGEGYINVTPEPETTKSATDEAKSETIPDFEAPPSTIAEPQPSEFENLTHSLNEFIAGYSRELNVTTASGANPYNSALAELKNPNATIETRKDMIDRLRKFLKAKGVNV
jgi:hypothetical protein